MSDIDRTSVKLEQVRNPAAGFFRLQEQLMDVSSDFVLKMKHTDCCNTVAVSRLGEIWP